MRTTQLLLQELDLEAHFTRRHLEREPMDRLDFKGPWSLKAGDHTMFSQPRGLVYRTFIMNHLVHHRAQLGVFLRMLGVTVPAVYSDSADEKGGMFM